MVARIDLAWRVLEITALALPALGILLQVIVHLDWEKHDSAPHHYQISSAMLFLIGPMAAVGIISAGVIAVSQDILWLKGAMSLMAVSFFFVPIVLFSVYRRARVRNDEFLDQEKDAIKKAAEAGEIPEDKAKDRVERIEVWQEGFLGWLSWRSEQLEKFYDRRPKLDLAVHGAMLIWWLYVIISEQEIFMTILGIPIALYAVAHIGSHFMDVQTKK